MFCWKKNGRCIYMTAIARALCSVELQWVTLIFDGLNVACIVHNAMYTIAQRESDLKEGISLFISVQNPNKNKGV